MLDHHATDFPTEPAEGTDWTSADFAEPGSELDEPETPELNLEAEPVVAAQDADTAISGNPLLRVASQRKLLTQEQEQMLGRRLVAARAEMTDALSDFGPCIRHLCAEWTEAVEQRRPPGEVLQWPAGERAQVDADGARRAPSPGGARQQMEELSSAYAAWAKRHDGTPPLAAPGSLSAAFRDAGPAFGMLCELEAIARSSVEAAPASLASRHKLERALERAAHARRRFQEARRVMLESNLRLVLSIAGKFVNNGIDFDDLVQEGSVGLLRAIEKFEPSLGFKFSTYASTWVWQAVTRIIANQRRTVRVPTHIHDKMIRVRGLAARLRQRTGREPTVQELAQASGLSTDVVTRALNAANRALSLDAPVRAGEDGTLIDATPDDDGIDALEVAQRDELAAIVEQRLTELPHREAVILRLRMGLGGTEVHTLEEIGAILGLTRERARQLQNRALDTLRARSHDLESALG